MSLDAAPARDGPQALPGRFRRAWILASIVSLTGMITANVLASTLPLNGLTTGAISDSYPIFFVPAGYAFSIWGLIYLGLIAVTVAQAVSPLAEEEMLGAARPLFVLSCFANGAWIFAWHYLQLGLSVLLMLTLLVSLIGLYRQIYRHGEGEEERSAKETRRAGGVCDAQQCVAGA